MNRTTPQYEPLTMRIGAELYPLGTTPATLLAEAAEKGETAALGLACRNREIAVRQAVEAATRALDATVADRAAGPLRATAVWLGDGDPAPRPGDTWDEVAAWGWKVTVAGTPLGRKDSYEAHDSEIMRLLVEENGQSPVPTPGNPGYGFWGAWKLEARESGNRGPSSEAAWTAMFAVHGDEDPNSRHNLGLRDVLDGKIGRKHAEELAESEPQTREDVERELRRMGDPLAWWSGNARG